MHPCGAAELIIDPLPAGAKREGALYPDGVHLKDLKEVRELLYKMQRPAIAPSVSAIIRPTGSHELITHRSSSTLTIGECFRNLHRRRLLTR